jgi:hypothetical protein
MPVSSVFFRHSCQEGLLMMSFPAFETSFLPSVLNGIFAGYRILDWLFFSGSV